MNFVHCSYEGQRTRDGRRFDGIGRYTFANGDVYVGGMEDGQFHGQGVIFFRTSGEKGNDGPATDADGCASLTSASQKPLKTSDKQDESEVDPLKAFLNQSAPSSSPNAEERWSGQYRGVWEHGRHVEGQYVFQDGLIYGNEDTDHRRFAAALWNYCHGSDQRLWGEYLENVAPVLPHEALLGGARLLHERKHAAAATSAVDERDMSVGARAEEGEGLPMVLPNAFVQARAAPAFASGQLVGVQDPRVARWTAAAVADEGAARTQSAASPEMTESTIALQLALSHSTAELRTARHSEKKGANGGAVEAEDHGDQPEGGAQTKLNLTVCRVKDVEDVNRELVAVVLAPS